MNTTLPIPTAPESTAPLALRTAMAVKVLGVGSAGASVLAEMVRTGFAVEHCALAHADAVALARAEVAEKIDLAAGRPRVAEGGGGLGEETAARLREFCAGAELVCLVAGLGGRTGTDLAAGIAQEAKAAGATVLAFVTLPFDCEGSLRQARAQCGLEQLAAVADGVLCLPNQKVFPRLEENTRLSDTFGVPTTLLAETITGLGRMIARPAQFRIHLEDICALLHAPPEASVFATAEAAGANRATEVVERLVAHPLLAGGQVLRESAAVVVSVAGGPDVTMAEVNRVMEQLNPLCEQLHVIMGTAIDPALGDRLAVTLLASSARELSGPDSAWTRLTQSSAGGERPSGDSDLGRQLLPSTLLPRGASRVVPPAPEMTPEEMRQLLAKQEAAGSRRRRTLPRPRQTQLQLEIISKGRFDKSEPTIHKGEDLDLPTYVRRGVVLN